MRLLSIFIKYGLVTFVLVSMATPVEALHRTEAKPNSTFVLPRPFNGFQKWVLKRVAKRLQKKIAKAKAQEKRPKPEILSLLGFSSSLLGLLILLSVGGIGLFLLGLGFFLSLVGLIRTSAHPKQHAKVSFLFAILGLLISGGVAVALLESVV